MPYIIALTPQLLRATATLTREVWSRKPAQAHQKGMRDEQA
jgi:hypothetical protein